MPATLHAVIAARVDRLSPAAKRTLNAAAVVGSRFSPELLTALGIDPVLDELVTGELIDQIGFTPTVEYAFRHPLIRAVAYESQLKSDRAELHRRLAAAIEQRAESADENAALDRRTPQGGGRSACGVRLVYARGHVVDPPRSRRGTGQLAARARRRRPTARR